MRAQMPAPDGRVFVSDEKWKWVAVQNNHRWYASNVNESIPTMIFCKNEEHALRVAAAINNAPPILEIRPT